MSETRSILKSRNFQLCFWSFFFLWISFDFFILFPLFILRKGGNAVDVGFQEAIFFFPSVLIRPIAGWCCDHIGRLKTLWTGSLMMILTGFSFLLLKGNYSEIHWWISLILFLRGAGFAAFYTAFFTYAADLSIPENRSRVIGLFGLSGLVGHGLAPLIGQNVLDRYQFSGFFLTSACLSLLSLIISGFLTEKKLFEPQQRNGFQIAKTVTLTTRNIIILPASFIFGYVVSSFNTFGAAYFELTGKAQVGYFFLVYGMTAGLVRILLGGLADRFPRQLLVILFFFLQAGGLCFIVLQPVEHFYLITAALAGTAHGILFPTMTAMAIDAHPQEYRGMVTSVFTGMMDVGFSLGSYIQGHIVALTSYSFMFLSTGLVGFLFVVYVVVLRVLRFDSGHLSIHTKEEPNSTI
ncbi:MAG: hypothetical protein C5B54_01980 [Acidobacteria bacterium]|nr:MAG: hypothetical protein C5B54_01980 [Acidobacteriota bacterium]